MTRTRKFEEIVKGMNYVSAELIKWKTSNDLNTESTHTLSFKSGLCLGRGKTGSFLRYLYRYGG